MNIFKSKLKGVKSQANLGNGNRSLAKATPQISPSKEEDAFVQDFLNQIKKQKTEIDELKRKLAFKEPTPDSRLRQINAPHLDATSRDTELQRKTQEVNQLRNELQKQDRLLQEHIRKVRNGQQSLKEAQRLFEVGREYDHEQLSAALKDFKLKTTQQREDHMIQVGKWEYQVSQEKEKGKQVEIHLKNEHAKQISQQTRVHAARVVELEGRLNEEKERGRQIEFHFKKEIERQSARLLGVHALKVRELERLIDEERERGRQIQTYLRNEHMTELQILKDRMEVEKRDGQSRVRELENRFCEEVEQKERRIQQLSNEIRSQTQKITRLEAEKAPPARDEDVIERLGRALGEKGQQIHQISASLEAKSTELETQLETHQQTRLTLNRTRNELNEEKRKACQATEESSVKNQQLEYVQQQCACLQEKLRDVKKPQIGVAQPPVYHPRPSKRAPAGVNTVKKKKEVEIPAARVSVCENHDWDDIFAGFGGGGVEKGPIRDREVIELEEDREGEGVKGERVQCAQQ